ncbi:Heme response regulator HssR [Fibrobacter succinogenes]|nr:MULTISPECIES: winged helix-turn-helix domain-containing protein [Fibrobacter]MCL4103187.1 Heme response regulator HssR [Fibrobacter succinogenes]MCQ2100346.1 winged helix-turn-helix domain-containing protein [Fibrobacter sp.]SHL09073.1 Transcriptional regulatory protein, C terminal [Fibrobacter sp. UWH6]
MTFKEYELLKLLMQRPGIVFSRQEIMERVWGVDFTLETRTVDMHVKTLRQKLGEKNDIIKTIRNVGYKAEV